MWKKSLRYFALTTNLLAIIWLLVTVYAAYKDTSNAASFISVLSYGLPFAILANIALSLAWLLITKNRKKWSLFSFCALIISAPVSKSVFGVNPFSALEQKKDPQQPNLKVMTFNVHLFDLGGWTKDRSTERKIIDFIKSESPDVMCLQEFYYDKSDRKEPFTELISNAGYPYFQFIEQNVYKKRRITSAAGSHEMLALGIAVFSKYPLTNRREVILSDNNHVALILDVQLKEDKKFTLLSTHLQSTRIGTKERNFIDKVKSEKDIQLVDNNATFDIIKKLSSTAQLRAIQANKIHEIKASIQSPLIICGDFNDVPGSYVYQTIKKGMKDPFISKGLGLSRTFSFIFPTLRIDHIFCDDRNWNIQSYHVRNVQLSDHLPVVAEFSLKK